MKIRYIGNKTRMLTNIKKVIHQNCSQSCKTFMDAFAGTNAVGEYFKPKYKIISNDIMFYSFCIGQAIIAQNHIPSFKKINQYLQKHYQYTNVFDYLNHYPLKNYQGGFITRTYSPISYDLGYSQYKRMYFQVPNAKRIDFIRNSVTTWNKKHLISKNEAFTLIAALLQKLDKVANVTGTYGAYLKHWMKRCYRPLQIKPLPVFNNHQNNQSYCTNAKDLIQKYPCDILYLDPPYNERGYDRYYFIPEVIANGKPVAVHGKTGIPNIDTKKSPFNRKRKVTQAMIKLLHNLPDKNVVMSYSTDGILNYKTLLQIIEQNAKPNTVKMYQFPYREFKSEPIQKSHKLKELLFYFQPQ